MRIPLLLVLLLASLAFVGCSSTRTSTYQVAVVNEGQEPVMLWLTKNGPPVEPQWLTPSQWLQLRADGLIPADVPEPGVELPPSMRVDLGPQTGEFDPESEAILLVYSAPVTLSQMAATPSRGSLMDIVFLEPGQNYVRVRSSSPVQAERVSRLVGHAVGGATTNPATERRP